MTHLSYTADARDNLRAIADFIADESGDEDVAESFIVLLDARCRKIASLPGTLGTARPELHHDLRSIPHKGYLIFFRYLDDGLEIVNILHGSRDVTAFYHGDDLLDR
jgi:toxin ParE1/3/4